MRTLEAPRGVASAAQPEAASLQCGPPARNGALDGIRTVAIAFVVLYHFHVPGFRGGFIGVNVFFVLSGYLITTLLLHERARTGRIRLPAFWLRRLLRLYPALLVMVLVGVLLWQVVDGGGGATLDPSASAGLVLSYTGNLARAYAHISQGIFSPTWSLSMEEQFYLVWPPILALVILAGLRRRWMLAGLTTLAIGSSVAAILLYRAPSGSGTPDIYFSPVLNVGPLVIGCALAVAMTTGRVRRVLAGPWGVVSATLGLAGILLAEFTLNDDWKQEALVVGLELPLVAVASALLIAGVTGRSSPIATAFSIRPVAWFGRNLSYSLYLWHMLVLAVVASVLSGVAGTVTAIGLSLVIAALSWLLIERPVGRLRKRLEGRRTVSV